MSWTAGTGTTSHDVYFGTNPVLDAADLQGNQVSTSYSPPTLTYSTTYYWRIDEVNAVATTTGTIWSFATEGAPTYTVSKVIHFDEVETPSPTTPVTISQHEGFNWSTVAQTWVIQDPDEPGLINLKTHSGRNKVAYFGWKQGEISRIGKPFNITQFDFAPGNYNNFQQYINGHDDDDNLIAQVSGFFDADTPQTVTLTGFNNITKFSTYELPGKVAHPGATDGNIYPGFTNLHVNWEEVEPTGTQQILDYSTNGVGSLSVHNGYVYNGAWNTTQAWPTFQTYTGQTHMAFILGDGDIEGSSNWSITRLDTRSDTSNHITYEFTGYDDQDNIIAQQSEVIPGLTPKTIWLFGFQDIRKLHFRKTSGGNFSLFMANVHIWD